MLREDKLSLRIYGPDSQPQQEQLHSSIFFLPSVLQKNNLSSGFVSGGFYTNTTTQPARWQSNLSEAGIHWDTRNLGHQDSRSLGQQEGSVEAALTSRITSYRALKVGCLSSW